jgi:Clp amino terminal domain, pathogenicity island component
MFHGDDSELDRVLARAWTLARDLGHPRVGSEHFLLALTEASSVATVLGARGATTAAIEEIVCRAAPAGAGAAADRDTLATIGIDIDRLLHATGPASLDSPPPREPVFPLGGNRARRRCARMRPPIGLDAQAVYAASLQLALARAEREHRSEHLLLALVTLDPGAGWVLRAANVPVQALLRDLAMTFPPPRRNLLLRAERRFGRRSRRQDLLRRYQHTTGRTAPAGSAIAALIAG